MCNSKRKCICECVGLVGGCVGEGSERAAKEKQKKGEGDCWSKQKKRKKTDGGNREIIKTPATAILECPSRHSPTVAIPPPQRRHTHKPQSEWQTKLNKKLKEIQDALPTESSFTRNWLFVLFSFGNLFIGDICVVMNLPLRPLLVIVCMCVFILLKFFTRVE